MPTCEQVKEEYKALKDLKKKFDLEFEKALATGNLARAKELRTKLEQKRDILQAKLIPREITAVWENPASGEKKEIILNIREQIKSFQEFYKNNLKLEINEREFKKIWLKNRREIQKEMATYGYDHILLLPENLPDAKTLNDKLIETMAEPPAGKVAATNQSGNFQAGGGFAGVKNTPERKSRIILTKNVQNTQASNDPLIAATLNKNIMQLTSLTQEEVERRIKNQEPLPIDFETAIKGKTFRVRAEGLSLEEYLIWQSKYFADNQKHLDENCWTWLLQSLSGARVVYSSWRPGARRRLGVVAYDPDHSGGFLGCRPSRSFSN